MKNLVIFRAVLVVVVAITNTKPAYSFDVISEEWKLFKTTYNRTYKSEHEDETRKRIFMENKQKIDAHNKLYERGNVSYNLAMNCFGDLAPHEFMSYMNIFNLSVCHQDGEYDNKFNLRYTEPSDAALPESIDWTTKGAVTEVKAQGFCGACWAFSSTGSLEAQHFLKTGQLVSLSEQNLIDCTGGYGNFGCNGGYMEKAFLYIQENGGIDTESFYPYTGLMGSCRYDPQYKGATVSGYVQLPAMNENVLKAAVATVGPISGVINTALPTFQFYRSGVFYDPDCNPKILNHAVLVVGYNTTPTGQDYWLVKNSWGTSWGMSGYIQLARNMGNHCGIAAWSCYPLV